MSFVPYCVRVCEDPVLRARGMSVVGSLEERNQAMLACSEFNEHMAKRARIELAERLFAESMAYVDKLPADRL